MTINDKKPEVALEVLTRWPNHPKEGITFLDICPLINQPRLFQLVVDWMASQVPPQTTRLVSPDARGFLFGAPVALACKLPLVPARKQGKLPGPVVSENYNLEYGQGTICIQESVIKPGDKIFAVDDILATGGTIAALKRLVLKQQAEFLGGICLLDIKGVTSKDVVCDQVKCYIEWDGN